MVWENPIPILDSYLTCLDLNSVDFWKLLQVEQEDGRILNSIFVKKKKSASDFLYFVLKVSKCILKSSLNLNYFQCLLKPLPLHL